MRLVGQVASALHTVHERGLVHRDIKPQNVLMWGAGKIDEHAFLTDFGIAKALHDVNPLTRVGALGTPGYMAPELRDGKDPTASCDQFSLACLAYELLTGRLPFKDDLRTMTRTMCRFRSLLRTRDVEACARADRTRTLPGPNRTVPGHPGVRPRGSGCA